MRGKERVEVMALFLFEGGRQFYGKFMETLRGLLWGSPLGFSDLSPLRTWICNSKI